MTSPTYAWTLCSECWERQWSIVMQRVLSIVTLPRLTSGLHHSLAVCLYTHYFDSLGLNVLIHKMGVITVPTSETYCKHELIASVNLLNMVPDTKQALSKCCSIIVVVIISLLFCQISKGDNCLEFKVVLIFNYLLLAL